MEKAIPRKKTTLLLNESIWIFFAASLLHFGYSFTRFYPLSFLCAVNESVWEHVKIVFFGALFFNTVQCLRGGRLRRSIPALVPALFSIPVTVPFLYYGYTGILGFHVFLLDLVVAWASGLICQIILDRLMIKIKDSSRYETLSLLFLVLMILLFFLFTWYPPRGLPMFVPSS